MTKGILTIGLLILANIFMTFAWYGHLKFNTGNLALPLIILISWGIALVEYCFQVPANRIGFEANGGPFNLWQLKVIQEVISLSVFTVFVTMYFNNEPLRWNHLAAFICLVMAVFFVFHKW